MSTLEIHSKIKLLPENIIDQIKAGEVIERPASLLKELIENSLDANATKISISIRQNGLELIEISDNGDGMSFFDLPFAFLRHATSKIHKFEDLYTLHSFGFRGEALASAASIAKIKCVSQPQNAKGGKIEIEGGEVTLQIENHEPEKGTTLYIKELFYNTPARLKFIKSSTSEKNAIEKIINGYLIANPKIEFHLKWDDKEKKIFTVCPSTIERVKKIFLPKEIDHDDVLEVTKEYNGINLKLILVNSNKTKGTQKCQYILANGRQIQDKQIHSIITHFAEGIIPNKQFSEYICMIEVAPQSIDVNVHPNKLFVKFHQSGELFNLISATLKSLLPTTDARLPLEHEQTQLKSSNTNHNQYHDLKDLAVKPNIETSFNFRSFLIYGYFVIENDRLYDLKNSLKEFFFNKKQETLPLMISEPLNIKFNEKQLSELGDLGFELDKLNQGQVILRGFPINFQEMNNREMVVTFLEIYLKSKTIDHAIEEFCENFNLKTCSTSFIERIINQAGLANTKIITKDSLKKL